MLNWVSDGLHIVPLLEIAINLAIGDFSLQFLLGFWDRLFVCVPNWPEIHSVDQGGIQLTGDLPRAGITAIHHHT